MASHPFRSRRIQFVLVLSALLLSMTVQPAHAAGVVGTGSAASCTSAALTSAVQGGGTISFNCGPNPLTIALEQTLDITAPSTTIDGGGLITLSGANQRRIIRHRSLSSSTLLTIRNLSLINGRAAGAGAAANGAAIQSIFQSANPSFKPTLILENVLLSNNISAQSGAGGNAYDFGGGAIYSQGGSVGLSGSTFSNNRADNAAGGAIHILQSGLTIASSIFDTNSAIGATPADSQGGAIYIDGLGGPTGQFRVTASSFTGNTSYNAGGAIYVNMYEDSSSTTIEDSSFVRNAIIGGNGALGGAIAGGGTNNGTGTGNPSISITGSTFASNTVRKSATPFDGSGGALAFAQRAVITISNSTFSTNRAEGSSFNANGGALYVVNNTNQFSVTNTTFANNIAGWVGGAISNSQISGNPGGVVRNTIFSNNSADNGPNDWTIQQHCSSELSDGGNNLQYPPRNASPNFFNEVSCFQGKSAINQRSLPDFLDPQLALLADTGGPTQTIPLSHTSPAIDAGNPATCPTHDQRGIARRNTCDIGAHEFAATPYLAALTPAFVQVGQNGITLTAAGADFEPATVLLWNGSVRATQFVSSTRLNATIPATDLASIATIPITVQKSGGNPSNARILQILEQVFQAALPLVVK